MTQDTIDHYVRSALLLQGYRLSEAATQEVSLQFARIQAIAASFAAELLPLETEPATVYRA
ncbi:DUF4089 domain-containing protein [Bordetella holmesii]|uniref:PF13318 family protein n=2 Tax=Bordetella holmesii TaxID=35814 RepID=A0A158M3S4_9BORD|nr:DUF4089 domain-containing protein [Bordetella holmesii]AHV92174.1 hypothetical protein D560_0087 [Bordetella holmesii ATCC 51541]AIT24783.1 hypothetical protein D558_0085 [Bordetella holmesii 44057]EWM45351.1 hypothetical protein D557_3349 [Bordetella holmesii 70147]EWM48220.1 hypothetical protein D556_0088 [Bordetella holmesii 41130]EWM49467.1 hypothetical protein D555_0086 [Bordetella holmesii 35009]